MHYVQCIADVVDVCSVAIVRLGLSSYTFSQCFFCSFTSSCCMFPRICYESCLLRLLLVSIKRVFIMQKPYEILISEHVYFRCGSFSVKKHLTFEVQLEFDWLRGQTLLLPS